MVIALLSQALGLTYADDQTGTRGIGQYPGRPSQFTAPQMVKDDTYRNIALNRMVYTSSNADFNLTGHLVTDGIITSKTPSFLSVRTNEGELSNRDKEKMIDGNTGLAHQLFRLVIGVNTAQNGTLNAGSVIQSELQELLGLLHGFTGQHLHGPEIRLGEGLEVNEISKQRLNFYLGKVDFFFLNRRSGNGRIFNFFLCFLALRHIRGLHCGDLNW